MLDLLNALLEYIWDFVAKLSIEIEENPGLSLELGLVIAVLAFWARRTYLNAVKGATGKGQFMAYKEVATKGTVVQTGTGMLVLLMAILSMLVILLLVFTMLGAS